jgi:predicted Zn-dependent protease
MTSSSQALSQAPCPIRALIEPGEMGQRVSQSQKLNGTAVGQRDRNRITATFQGEYEAAAWDRAGQNHCPTHCPTLQIDG